MPPAQKQVEQQLSPRQAARRIGVDQSTIFRWIRDGKIKPVRKLGRRITRIPASAVNRFLESRTVTS